MTRVAFHFNVPDRLLYCCRLSRKALAGGARLWITGPGPAMRQLDTLMWTFSALDFVPHGLAQAPGLPAATPVLLSEHTTAQTEVADRVLVNLGADVPAHYARFLRVIDIVGLDEAERAQARQRWKYYTGQGDTIERHDVQLSSQD